MRLNTVQALQGPSPRQTVSSSFVSVQMNFLPCNTRFLFFFFVAKIFWRHCWFTFENKAVFLSQPLHPNAEPYKSTDILGEILTFCMMLGAWRHSWISRLQNETCWINGLQNASRAGGWPSMAHCLERRHEKLEGSECTGPWRLVTFTCNVWRSSEVWWWGFCLKWALYLCLWGCQLDFIDQILTVHLTMLAMIMNGPELVSQGVVVRTVNHQDQLGWRARESKLKCPYASSM